MHGQREVLVILYVEQVVLGKSAKLEHAALGRLEKQGREGFRYPRAFIGIPDIEPSAPGEIVIFFNLLRDELIKLDRDEVVLLLDAFKAFLVRTFLCLSSMSEGDSKCRRKRTSR